MRAWRAALTTAALAVLTVGCGVAASDTAGREGPRGEVVVFAAASLGEAFGVIAEAVEAEHPDLDVVLNLAGSQQLAGQILEGAPADVLASADTRQMDVVVDAGLVEGEPTVFATNTLAIAVEPGNPLGIAGLDDLAADDVTLVLAAEEVPAGRYAAEVLSAAAVEVAPASREVDVRAVLSKVALGEADAGIVYRSDVVAAAGDVEEVVVPEEVNVDADYPIAALTTAPNPDGAAVFVAAVTSAAGQRTLAELGFSRP